MELALFSVHPNRELTKDLGQALGKGPAGGGEALLVAEASHEGEEGLVEVGAVGVQVGDALAHFGVVAAQQVQVGALCLGLAVLAELGLEGP